jgi:hypothetical protein
MVIIQRKTIFPQLDGYCIICGSYCADCIWVERKAKSRKRKAESKKLKAESKKQKAKSGKQKAESGKRKAKSGKQKAGVKSK